MAKRKEGRATMLVLKDIVRDPRLQVRDGVLSQEQAEDIAEYAKKKGPIPNQRLIVYMTCRPESINVPAEPYLVGGFHRAEGYEMAGLLKVPVTIYEGTWADALRAAAKENVEHLGLRRTRADKRRAIQLMLEADPKMSAREIAEHIRVSHPTVVTVRRELLGETKEVVNLPPKGTSVQEQVHNGVQHEPQPEEPNISGPVPNPPRQGEEQEFRWQDAALTIGSLVKQIDKAANFYKRKKSLEHQGLMRKMAEVEKDFRQWYEWCKKELAKESK